VRDRVLLYFLCLISHVVSFIDLNEKYNLCAMARSGKLGEDVKLPGQYRDDKDKGVGIAATYRYSCLGLVV
jgi:hypothetical protein